MSINKSLVLNTDSYTTSMGCQYPDGTEVIRSYIESRGGLYDQTVMFGLQAFIKEYLVPSVTKADVDLAQELWTAHGEPFDRQMWDYIVNELDGKLPLHIKAVPEGSIVPTKNVLAVIENTEPTHCRGLTTWAETATLRGIWYPTTVATQSRNIKQLILQYLEETGDPSGIDFKLHDFGARGVSSFESAGLGAMGHLVNFKGTDTMTGILYAREYYNAPMAGFSIPAMEHSTATSWGRDKEADAYRNMLKHFAKPGAVVACVSDSYDVFNAVENIWGEELRQQVIDSGAVVVIRPDSGDPEKVCGRLVEILGEKFGYTTNSKGYKVLNNVRLIQGDGVNQRTIHNILGHFKVYGWSADNISFGMGGALLQQLDRDTQKFAMKCSAAQVNGEWRDVFKDPITDSGKTSKKGKVTLYKDGNGGYFTDLEGRSEEEALVTVFKDGELFNELTFEQVRANAAQ